MSNFIFLGKVTVPLATRVVLSHLSKLSGDVTMSFSQNVNPALYSDTEALRRHHSKKFRQAREFAEAQAAKHDIQLKDYKSNLGYYLGQNRPSPTVEPSMSFKIKDTEVGKAKQLAESVRDHLKQESVLLFEEHPEGEEELLEIVFPKDMKPSTIAKWVEKLKVIGGSYHTQTHSFTTIAFSKDKSDPSRKFVEELVKMIPGVEVRESVVGTAHFV